MTNELTRRNVMKSAAWAIPVVALAVATPAAAASETCEDYTMDGGYFTVSVFANSVVIYFKSAGNATDATIRTGDGSFVWHTNYVTQGKNPGDNQTLYKAGDSFTIATPKRLTLADGDFLQVATIHLTC